MDSKKKEEIIAILQSKVKPISEGISNSEFLALIKVCENLYDDGHNEGREDGYGEGREDGYDAGYDAGYDEGYGLRYVLNKEEAV